MGRKIPNTEDGWVAAAPLPIYCAVLRCDHHRELHRESGCVGRVTNHGFHSVNGTVACGCVRYTDDVRDEA